VSFAEIALLAPDSAVVSRVLADSAGAFSLVARPGEYRLRVQRIGYTTLVTERLVLRYSENVAVELRLSPRGIPLEPLVVMARGGLEPGRFGFARRCALGKGVCLNRDSIAARRPVVATDAFHGVPGLAVLEQVTCVDTTIRCDPVITSMRGGKCLAVYTDHTAKPYAYSLPFGSDDRTDPRALGTRDVVRGYLRKPHDTSILGRLAAGGAGLNVVLDPKRFEGIEIYRSFGEIPQELRSGIRIGDLWPAGWHEGCGIALVWTSAAW
jgi:hypothetical protein